MKRQVNVTIAGQRFALRSDGDDEAVQHLAGVVDRKIRSIQKQSPRFDTQQIAILAALQIAEELQQERGQREALKKQVREKGRSLLKLLNAVA